MHVRASPSRAAWQTLTAGAFACPIILQAVLNPLSKPAQQLAPLLLLLRDVFDVDMHVMLNPQVGVCGVAACYYARC